ncbi:hypothetical protein MP228_005658 [Amoeboaphelidium protococcarum]|nr:hypothetical protein MP228_005658 [Amoeboaphelidium protococcarum]
MRQYKKQQYVGLGVALGVLIALVLYSRSLYYHPGHYDHHRHHHPHVESDHAKSQAVNSAPINTNGRDKQQLLINALSAVHPDLTVKEVQESLGINLQMGNDQICASGLSESKYTNTNYCYPTEVHATDKDQLVLYGQVIPPGLYVKMDFQTGIRSVRLLNDSDRSPTKHGDNAAMTEDLIVSPDQTNTDNDRQDLSHLPKAQQLYISLQQSQQSNSNADEQLEILDKLEEAVHDYKVGVEFAKVPNAIQNLFKMASSIKPKGVQSQDDGESSTKIRQKLYLIMGVMCENNQKVQDLITAQIPDYLDQLLKEIGDKSVQGEVLFAISNYVRGNTDSIQNVAISAVSSQIGKQIDDGASSQRYNRRVVELMQDLLFSQMEKSLGEDSSDSNGFGGNNKDVVSSQWCDIIKKVYSISGQDSALVMDAAKATSNTLNDYFASRRSSSSISDIKTCDLH